MGMPGMSICWFLITILITIRKHGKNVHSLLVALSLSDL